MDEGNYLYINTKSGILQKPNNNLYSLHINFSVELKNVAVSPTYKKLCKVVEVPDNRRAL